MENKIVLVTVDYGGRVKGIEAEYGGLSEHVGTTEKNDCVSSNIQSVRNFGR